MLTAVDRVQIAVRDRDAAAETFRILLGAEAARSDEVKTLGARRSVVQAGASEFELLEPAGEGPVADFVAARGEGLFAAGFATPNLDALCRRLEAKGVRYLREGEQAFIAKDQTYGMRVVLSPERERRPVGLIRFLYEVTNVVGYWQAARDRYVDIFGREASRFCPITSEQWGYTGTLTLFRPPDRLDRIEITQTTDPAKAMGRFHARYGDELYMCYVEADDVDAIADRLDARGGRYQLRNTRPGLDGLWIHPTALHGVLMGVSRTTVAWSWSGRPELVQAAGSRQ